MYILYIGILALPLALLPARAKSVDSYVGWKTCVGCHEGYEGAMKDSMHRSLFVSDKADPKLGCEACHGPGAPHMDDPAKITKFKAGEKVDVKAAKACLKCHNRSTDTGGFMKSRHARKGVSCISCHSVHKKGVGEASLVKKETDLCATCHPEKKAQSMSAYRHPIAEGKVGCTDCHSPHTAGAAASKTYTKACVKCHQEKAGPFRYEHEPVVDNCAECHSPHGAASENLLTVSRPALCLQCHAGDMRSLASHDITDVNSNKCTTCHKQVHGSNSSRTLSN